MKKGRIIALILIIVVILIGFGVWKYFDIKENERIDREAVTLKPDLTIEFGKEAKVSDFIENLNGILIDDHKVNTEVLGDIEVEFEFMNIKNKKRNRTFTITIIDKTAPKIFSGSSFTVKTGYSKNLEDVLLSGDDIDDNPKREIIGDYDVNAVGDYNLTYTVTDSSGNKTSKEFVLHVVDKQDNNTSTREPVYFDDVIDNYKTENTKIGIDVSKWQGDIDWEKVKNAGVEFAIIRMGYQTDYDGEYKVDPYFVQNMEGAKQVRITRSEFTFIHMQKILIKLKSKLSG